jgi:Lon protease-like protein
METLSYTLPIFPLTREVLFPRARLPLYVFEPRYISLVNDCIHADHRLGVALVRSRRPLLRESTPPLHQFLGVGRIIDSTRLPDGKYNILVEGVERARLLEEIPHGPYRVASLRPLGDRYDTVLPEALGELFREMTRLAQAVTDLLPKYRRPLRTILHTYQHPSIVADLLAFHFIPHPYDRQCVMEEMDVGRRLRLVSVQLRILLRRLSHGAIA